MWYQQKPRPSPYGHERNKNMWPGCERMTNVVYNYKTGAFLGTVDRDTYNRYLREIGEDPVGAVPGEQYGFSGHIYMVEE